MKSIRQLGKKKVDLNQISDFYKVQDYKSLYDLVLTELEKGILAPIKSSKTNGKKPALYHAYRVMMEEVDEEASLEELQYGINSTLATDYYIQNRGKYKEDRPYIMALNSYINDYKEQLQQQVSLNERSFEIWGREKFLQKEGGRRILKNLGLSMEALNIYETTVPLPYYAHHKNIPQNVLILENKDTFYSMRRHLLQGHTQILGVEIGTLIYGGGKNIHKTFKDFTYCVEPYLSDTSNTLLYFGDLDYEGIVIYESLKATFEGTYTIHPFRRAYQCMLDKAEKRSTALPKTKEGQNRHIKETFLTYFELSYKEKIMTILEKDQYIPQEILNRKDFEEGYEL